MCYGCMGFKSATQLTQKQLDFLDKTPEEQIELMEKNLSYCPNKPLSDQMAKVENLLPIDEWSIDKVSVYLMIAQGRMGLIGQFNAIKLLTLYEQWVKYHDTIRYQEYQDILNKQKGVWKIFDKQRIESEAKECYRISSIWPQPKYDQVIKMYKGMEKDKLDELEEIYS